MAKGLIIPSIFTAVDKLTGPVDKMSRNASSSMARMERKFRKVGDAAFSISRKSLLIGTALVAPLAIFANSAIKFEDKMADVAKTTGLVGDRLTAVSDGILDISQRTRTSIDEIQSIAEIGGQLGIAQDELLSFVEAADKFNIALGKDFGGVEEAVAQVGKIKGLFEATRLLDVADSINKVGSVINDLGASGNATSANIADFALGLGALPDALKPSIQSTLALGAFLEEMGIDSKRAASGVTGLFLTAGRDIAGFSKQMDITQKAAKQLLATDPTEFAVKFAETFKGVAPDVLSRKLNDLGLNSKEVIKVVGALSSASDLLAKKNDLANKSFALGISLQEEAATKNATTAAKAEIAKNNMEALSITLGQALIPVITDLLQLVTPMIKSFGKWAKENKDTVKTIAKVVVGAAALAFAIAGISAAVGIASKAFKIAKVFMGAYNIALGISSALSGTASIAIGRSGIALKAYAITTKIITAAQWLWNAALAANPIVLMIAAIGLAVVAVVSLTKAFNTQSRAQKLQNEVTKTALENTIDQRVEVMLLFKTLRKATAGSDEYNKTLQKLEEIQPGIIKNFNLQEGAIDGINRAEKALIKNIIKRGEAEARSELIREKTKQQLQLKEGGLSFFEQLQSVITPGGSFLVSETKRLKGLQLGADIEELATQEAESRKEEVSPGVTSSESIFTAIKEKFQKTIVDFKNVPLGTKITGNDEGSTSFAKPILGTTD